MADIRTSDDVAWLVRRFYRDAIPDELLGPIFESSGIEWEHHIPLLISFWERQLLGVPGYNGNVVLAHSPYRLEDRHFARWLELWDEAIDEQFAGPVAEAAKARARGAADVLKRAQVRRPLPMTE